MNNQIDFVITWVDGNDPEWIREKEKYSQNNAGDNREIRFRDWGILKYWFRSIEKFAPWVNKIYFITWGHLPAWLNTNNPKLIIVKHEDYIPSKYLPTFNSHTIEWNIHRIKGLSDNFVYFNDDTFLCQKTDPTYFFKNNIPCDSLIEGPHISTFRNSVGSIVANNMEIINDRFNKRSQMKKNFMKWFNPVYGKSIILNFFALIWTHYVGFLGSHIPNSYNKQTFIDLWSLEYDILDQTCSHKFRDKRDVNHWLARGWQLATCNFVPRSPRGRVVFKLSNNNEDIIEAIKKQKYRMICINDRDCEIDFENQKALIQDAFESILPEKSSYEK